MPTMLPGLGIGPRGPWQHGESWAAGFWQDGRVSSDMCSLKLAAGTSWPRAQVSLSQPLTAHQPAPHWAGAPNMKGAPEHPRSQKAAIRLTQRQRKSLEGPRKKGKSDKPQPPSRALRQIPSWSRGRGKARVPPGGPSRQRRRGKPKGDTSLTLPPTKLGRQLTRAGLQQCRG